MDLYNKAKDAAEKYHVKDKAVEYAQKQVVKREEDQYRPHGYEKEDKSIVNKSVGNQSYSSSFGDDSDDRRKNPDSSSSYPSREYSATARGSTTTGNGSERITSGYFANSSQDNDPSYSSNSGDFPGSCQSSNKHSHRSGDNNRDDKEENGDFSSYSRVKRGLGGSDNGTRGSSSGGNQTSYSGYGDDSDGRFRKDHEPSSSYSSRNGGTSGYSTASSGRATTGLGSTSTYSRGSNRDNNPSYSSMSGAGVSSGSGSFQSSMKHSHRSGDNNDSRVEGGEYSSSSRAATRARNDETGGVGDYGTRGKHESSPSSRSGAGNQAHHDSYTNNGD